MLIDCHSFPSRPLPYDQTRNRPEIYLGTARFHTPDWLTELAESLFSDAGFRVAINRPFSGALVPEQHFQKDKRVLALIVELNRATYMDESTGDRLLTFGSTAAAIRGITGTLIDKTQRRITGQ